MTALASTDVTVSVSRRDKDMFGGMRKATIADITFGDGALTYPTGGVPLPAKGAFGFTKEIAMGLIEQPPGNGFIYKYDRANHKLKILNQKVTTGSTTVTTSASGALIENENGAETVARLYGTAVDTTYNLGQLGEVSTAHAPASTTVRMIFFGD